MFIKFNLKNMGGKKPKEDKVMLKLKEHDVVLSEHGVILAKHSTILNEHSIILANHSSILAKHSVVLDEHSVILSKHSVKLDKIDAILDKIVIKLVNHDGRLENIEEKLTHMLTVEEFNNRMDGFAKIYTDLKDEYVFNNSTLREHSKDIKQLKIACNVA